MSVTSNSNLPPTTSSRRPNLKLVQPDPKTTYDGTSQGDIDMDNLKDLREIKNLTREISDVDLVDAIWRLADRIQQRIDSPMVQKAA